MSDTARSQAGVNGSRPARRLSAARSARTDWSYSSHAAAGSPASTAAIPRIASPKPSFASSTSTSPSALRPCQSRCSASRYRSRSAALPDATRPAAHSTTCGADALGALISNASSESTAASHQAGWISRASSGENGSDSAARYTAAGFAAVRATDARMRSASFASVMAHNPSRVAATASAPVRK